MVFTFSRINAFKNVLFLSIKTTKVKFVVSVFQIVYRNVDYLNIKINAFRNVLKKLLMIQIKFARTALQIVYLA
jgi:hypothetical protein